MPDGFSFREALAPEDDQPKSYYERNKAWTKPGTEKYRTDLSPAEEAQFKAWVKANNVPNDDRPQSDYDMRGFWKALQAKDPKATSAVDPNDKRMHYPDYWKTPYHETFSAESQWADPKKAPKWNDKDQLVGQDGKVLFDDRAQGFSFQDALKPEEDRQPPAPDTYLSRLVAKPSDQSTPVLEGIGAGYRRGRAGVEPILTPKAQAYIDSHGPSFAGQLAGLANEELKEAGGVIGAIQGGAEALGTQLLGPQAGRDIAGIPEAFAGMPGALHAPEPPVARAAEAARPRVEPSVSPPGAPPEAPRPPSAPAEGPPTAPTTEGPLPPAEAPPTPAPETTGSVELGGFTLEEAKKPYVRSPDTQPTPLAEAGITPKLPEPAAETGTVAQPQADATVKQVGVQTGEPPPPAEPPPPEAPTAPGDLRALFPNLSDEQFEAIFQEASKRVPPKPNERPSDYLQRVANQMAGMTQEPKPEAPEGAFGGPWEPIIGEDGKPAKNELGEPIFVNPNGTRAVMDAGVPHTEPVTETEKGLEPKAPDARKPKFMTQDEAKPPEKPAEEPKEPEAKPPAAPTSAAAPAPIAQEPPKPKGRKAGTSAIPSIRDTEKPPEPEGAIIPPGDNYWPPVRSQEVVRSQSGREMAPAPKFSVENNRKANVARGKMDGWLVDETQKEAESKGDTGAYWIKGLNPKNVSPADREMMIEYLWGNDVGPTDEHRGPKPDQESAPTEHPGLVIKTASGKMTTIQPIGTVPPKPPQPEPAPKSAETPDLTTPPGWPEGELADAWRRGRDDAVAGKPSVGLRIKGQSESQAYIEGYHSVRPPAAAQPKPERPLSVQEIVDAEGFMTERESEDEAGRIHQLLYRGWSPEDISEVPGITKTPREIRAIDRYLQDDFIGRSDWFEDSGEPPPSWRPKAPWEQLELPLTQKQKYDALYPSDTPAATGKPQEAPDGEGQPSGDGGLGEPGSGQIRSPGSGSGVGGGKGGGPKLASAPADDVAPAGGVGNTGQDGVRPGAEDTGDNEPLPDGGDATDGRPPAGGPGVDDAGTGGKPGPELDLSDTKEPKPPKFRGPEVDLPAATRPNFFISEPERMVGGGDKARFNRNRRAIEAFQAITEEGREPTAEELETMAGFTGWGSFGQDLFQGTFERQPPRPGWDAEAQWLRNHLGKAAWDAAHNSISNAHYTDPPTVQAMWDMVRQMGFKGGRVLEPSIGIGNFFGLMPRDLMAQSTLTGIELDPTTGGMAKLLYPEAGVFIKGYQDSKTPDNFYDLVIGNWPFDATPPADRRYNRLKPTLHDYFYLKALDQTRPGGLVIGITSAGTMDKLDRAARMEMARKGELVAAFRLPTGAFEKYAGTKVVTDIIILRKRSEPLQDPSNEPWINTKDMETPSYVPIRVNQYFHDHPENVLGTFDYGHGTTTFRAGMLVHRPDNMMERLQALPGTLPEDAYRPINRGGEPRFLTSNTADRLNSIVIGNDDNLYQVAGERMLRLEDVFKGMTAGTQKVQKERSDQVRALVKMRKAYGALIDAERDGSPDQEDLRKALREQYEAYNKPAPGKKQGRMIDTAGMKVLDRVRDPNWPMLAALQRPDGSPALILSAPIMRPKLRIGNPSVSDAYVMARNESATINMERIAELSGRSVEEAAKTLMDAGAVYRTPGGGYEAADGYLSGNVRMKLREAQDALDRGEPMEASVEALTKAVPKNTPYYLIEAKFGAPWVTPEDYKQFIAQELLGMGDDKDYWGGVNVAFQGSRWTVDLNVVHNNSIEGTQTHGHPRYRFDRLLTAAMGNTAPRIMDPRDRDGGPYYNAKASEEVATRIQEIREKFQDWIWKDAERTVRLEAAFNEVMNAIAKPHFDGSFMDMSGMALLRGDDPFNMRRHQANGIWRGISLRRGLFAHEVGTGKTYTIGGIAIEGRRYGRWNKPMLIAHNANSKSVARDIQAMYPGAKVLSIDSDDLTPKTLKQTMYSIRNEDWDLVVVQHSHLNRFALKKDTLLALARDQITEIEDEMYAAAAEDGDNIGNVNLNDEKDIDRKMKSITAKQLAKQRLKILNKIEEQGQRASREDAVPFEDLGVDCILVDEAHEFKKPPIATRMKVKGLNTEASSKSIGLDFLTKYIKNNNNGNNVFLFTGTPITNSLNEIFNMAKYFMDDVMKRDGIGDWDTWFNTFADALPDVELVETGDYETVKRLSSFNNVDELVRVMSQFTDVVQASDMPEFVDRPTPSGKTLSSPDLTDEERDFLENGRTENPVGRPYKRIINDVSEILPEQAVIQEELRAVIRNYRNETPKFRKENRHIPVVVGTQMANASLDARMHDPSLKENPNNKINRVARNVLEIYKTPKAAQMIFVDNGYNPGKLNPNFSAVADLVNKLVAGGIPRNEIAIVAGGLEPDQKARIAAEMNSGKIRVAIGLSNTLGVGVNAQDNLRAMHHMDAPWMPGELEQRDGRGHRAGNAWNTVLEYRYITEGIDGKRWQVLTVKDRFIKQFISAFNDESGKRIGSIEGDAADISEKEDIVATLSAAAGDPRLMLREKLKSDVNRLQRREQQHTYGVADATRRARQIEESIVSVSRHQAVVAGYVNRWVEAQERMEKAAEEAKAKVRWYDAVIDGVPLKTSAEIQNAIDERVSQLAQAEGKVLIGSINGFGLESDWPKGWTEPQFVLLDENGKYIPGTGMTALTVNRIVGRIQAFRKEANDELPGRIENMKSDVEKLKKAAELPFTQGEALLKKRQQLAKVEDDLEENPVPPPAWLRHGAPIDTPIWVDGQERIVRGHRMSDDYYVVTDDGDVPYMAVTDQNGFSTFTKKPPPARMAKELPQWFGPELAKAGFGLPGGSMTEGTEVIWHSGDLVLIKGRRDGETMFLGFKKGLPEDRQAHDVWDTARGSFEVKDIERMRKEAQNYRDREENKAKLEQEAADPDEDIVRGGHTKASGRYVSPAWNLTETPKDR
jgi:N12 class adenine-specific DNA methylase